VRHTSSERVPCDVTVDVVLLTDIWSSSVHRYDTITVTTLEETVDVEEIEHGHPAWLHTSTTGLLFSPCVL
jgi:hypothetical protein